VSQLIKETHFPKASHRRQENQTTEVNQCP